MHEIDTRSIPIGEHEIQWARNRPAVDRTPIPEVGDTVEYRHDGWGPVYPAEVVWVQPLDDHDDPHLWTVERDPATGAVLLLEGKPVFVQALDPWPLLKLKIHGLGVGETREARLRGSAGWLPLDWRARRRPMPYVINRTSEQAVLLDRRGDGGGPAPIAPTGGHESGAR